MSKHSLTCLVVVTGSEFLSVNLIQGLGCHQLKLIFSMSINFSQQLTLGVVQNNAYRCGIFLASLFVQCNISLPEILLGKITFSSI